MRLHTARAVVARPGAGAAGDRLVILIALVTESEVVHRALRGCLQAERAVERIDDALRGLDVARHHGAGPARVEHRTGRHHDRKRSQATGVERDWLLDQRAEHVQDCRHGHGAWRVEIVLLLRRGAGEVYDGRTLRAVDADADLNCLPVVELVAELAVGEPADRPPRARLGVVLDVLHVSGEAVVAGHERGALELADAAGIGRELRAEIGEILLGFARRIRARAQQPSQQRLIEAALADDARRGDDNAFLVDVPAAGRHRARGDPADVGVMRA
jgi:hypothetical protein